MMCAGCEVAFEHLVVKVQCDIHIHVCTIRQTLVRAGCEVAFEHLVDIQCDIHTHMCFTSIYVSYIYGLIHVCVSYMYVHDERHTYSGAIARWFSIV